MRFVRIFSLSLFLVLGLSSCGSDSGSPSPIIRILSPADGSIFTAGSQILFELEMTDFELAPPFNLRSSISKNHPGDDDSEEESHQDSDNESDDDHAHNGAEINPAAREGHYHVYLDEASGSDPHLTAWTYTGQFSLPSHISQGTHFLRFELRDNNHVPVGTSGSEAIVFFEVQ